ncbi:unnamed protein product [Linum trigynum]|uniref:Uncharacterized protein n=1 Tax=Linum trigynum TaxID=586398 RepID=A0AAV2DCH1_9ROSI
MPISSSFVFFFLFLCLPHRRSTAFPVRRILHQPFFPLDTLPPAPSPSSLPPPPPPPTPPAKLPFSNTGTPTATNPAFPFFPTYPSPPPPPSPSTFASFPTNISSLILSESPSSKPPSSSHKLLALSLSFLAVAVIVSAVLAFYFCRRQRSANEPPPGHDAKTHASSDRHSSSRFYAVNPDRGSGSRHKLRPTNTSSEFLYLGTLVNSHGIGDGGGSNPAAAVESPVVGKMDSPELRPLRPLNRQNPDGFGSPEDDEEEEFYSPRGLLGGGGRDSSVGAGSGSNRMFRDMGGPGPDFGEGETTDSISCSSDSSSGSPARSQSVSISPPASLSPRNKSKTSPESARVVYPGPAPAPPCPPMPPRRYENELLSSVIYNSGGVRSRVWV